jgi:hypothetical protein
MVILSRHGNAALHRARHIMTQTLCLIACSHIPRNRTVSLVLQPGTLSSRGTEQMHPSGYTGPKRDTLE